MGVKKGSGAMEGVLLLLLPVMVMVMVKMMGFAFSCVVC